MIDTASFTPRSKDRSFLEIVQGSFWSGEGVTPGRILAVGALVWFLYSVVVVLVQGVTLDQDIVPAQVIAGAVRYPPGHPHEIFYHSIFNLPSYFLAGLWRLTPDPILISALRNYVFMFLSAFVPFAAAVVLTGRPGWGYLAATFSLSGAAHSFHGIYPVMFYPEFDSDGHIGQHMAVLIVVLLLGGFWRWGGFFLGLLPAVHPTMAAVVWPWSVCYIVMTMRQGGDARQKRHTVLAVSGGLAVCGALALLIFLAVPNSGSPPPYNVHADGSSIYRIFETTSDIHRRPLPLSLPGYNIHPIALFIMIGLLFWKPRSGFSEKPSRQTVLWVALLAVFVWAYVFLGSGFIHSSFGWVAQWVRITMPGRFSNLTALMIIPLCVALIARSDRGPLICIPLLIVQASVAPFNPGFLGNLLFSILGAAFVTDAYLRWDSASKWKALLPAAILIGTAAGLYFARAETGIFGLSAGMLIAAVVLHARRIALPVWSLQAAVVLTMVVSLAIPMQQHPEVRITPYDRQLNRWLAEHAAPGESILTPMGPPPEIQVKTNHPVMMERESLVLMTYEPALAGVLGSMARDLYNVDYSNPSSIEPLMDRGTIALGSRAVLRQWQSMTADQWRSAARKYNFRLVLTLTSAPLNLTAVLPGKEWTLYSIE